MSHQQSCRCAHCKERCHDVTTQDGVLLKVIKAKVGCSSRQLQHAGHPSSTQTIMQFRTGGAAYTGCTQVLITDCKVYNCYTRHLFDASTMQLPGHRCGCVSTAVLACWVQLTLGASKFWSALSSAAISATSSTVYRLLQGLMGCS